MRLYHHPISPNARPVLATIEHLGLTVEEEIVDLRTGAQQSEDFLSLNPNGKIPVLVDDDLILWESGAICQYLADAYGEHHLYPREPRGRAEVTRWMAWRNAHFHPACSALTFERVFKPMLELEKDDAKIEEGKAGVDRLLPILDDHVASHDFLLGRNVSVADFIVASSLTFWKAAGIPVDQHERVKGWLDRLDGVEAWKATEPSM